MSFPALLSLSLCFSMMSAGFLHSMPDRDPASTLFVVNTSYRISEDFIPDVRSAGVPGQSRHLQAEAAHALEALFAAAKQEQLNLYSKSAYRSYGRQKVIFGRKVNANKGSEEKANLYVALPGASEHQLGLAADIIGRGDALHPKFADTAEGRWLAENAHRYGFIIRYPQGKEWITGIQYEPWHLRYVGKKVAEEMLHAGLSLEEYTSKKRAEHYQYLLNLNKD